MALRAKLPLPSINKMRSALRLFDDRQQSGTSSMRRFPGTCCKWDADLIVVGSHGRTGLDRLVLGSVAESVIRTAQRPVLMIYAN
jgi:nucleotide-binding universal stress UspA family protein